jgi:hypothetical protein
MTCGPRFLARLPVLLVGAALALFGSATALGAQSQATTGIIRGVVTDPNGAPVANAQVILHETQTNFTRTLTTDAAGNFTGTLLPLGRYDVTARSVGYAEVKRTGIALGVGETVDLRLPLSAVTLAPVTVEATRPVVDVTKAESSTPLAADVVSGLPNNGRNFINLTLLTPNVAIVQGPDGDELTVAGQRGIHNNVSVDGADFNNSFFGEQRGGQRPAFTFNLDAVQELVVVAGGANAEFGRSSGGFVNVITKSGTNELRGSLHYFGKFDALSGTPEHTGPLGVQKFNPDFRQHQFGFTLGGPLKRDRVFYFLAYDQQIYDDVKQKTRPSSPQLDSLTTFLTARYPELANDFGSIARTNDARAALAKLDFRLSDKHNLSLKYNYTWAEQQNGTFDVDTWGASANGLEQSHSHAVNGSLVSFLSSRTSNELRFQFSREDRPRPYTGPNNHLGDTTGVSSIFGAGVPFHDTDIDTTNAFRIGLPFFLPIRDDHDTRIQLLDNVSISRGNHLIKLGGEWNRTSTTQVFVGFANGRMAFNSVTGFINFVNQGSHYVECRNRTTAVFYTRNDGQCNVPTDTIVGPVNLYLQQSGVGTNTVEQAGTQTITQNELAVFLQDTWKPSAKLTLNYGLRWEAQLEPDPITPPSQVFFGPWIDSTVNGHTFPSNGLIPSDKKMWQPRLGIAWDPNADGRQVFRFNAGLYYARIPALNLASVRSTNGSLGQTLFGSSGTVGFLPPPAFDSLLPLSTGTPFQPTVYVVDRAFQNPRTLNVTAGYERQIANDLAASISYTHARTDHLTRFLNRNDPNFGSPFGSGPTAIGTLFTVESSAKSRYNGVTVGLKRVLDPNFQFDVNYTLSFDKADDDNERDPFTFRYAQVDSLNKEYNWSDRDQRHRFNGWFLSKVAGFYLNNRVSYYSAQPASETCVGNQPSGIRASSPQQRICADGHILLRNTIRKDNAYFSWDIRISRPFAAGPRGRLEALIEVFNVTNADNFRDPAAGTNYKNFDGTIRSGLGDPRQLQAGLRWVF